MCDFLFLFFLFLFFHDYRYAVVGFNGGSNRVHGIVFGTHTCVRAADILFHMLGNRASSKVVNVLALAFLLGGLLLLLLL